MTTICPFVDRERSVLRLSFEKLFSLKFQEDTYSGNEHNSLILRQVRIQLIKLRDGIFPAIILRLKKNIGSDIVVLPDSLKIIGILDVNNQGL